MRLPRRGVLIRLVIYLPLFGFLGWRVVQARCGEPEPTVEPEPSLQDDLAPYRKTILLPDGTTQEIVEMTPEQAEAVLGHPLPREPDPDEAEAPAKPNAEGGPEAEPADGDEPEAAPADGAEPEAVAGGGASSGGAEGASDTAD